MRSAGSPHAPLWSAGARSRFYTRRVVWTQAQAAVIEHVFALADRGVEVIYIPGNHDEALRALIGTEIRGVRILRNLEHEAADGRPVDLPPELAWLRSASVGTFWPRSPREAWTGGLTFRATLPVVAVVRSRQEQPMPDGAHE